MLATCASAIQLDIGRAPPAHKKQDIPQEEDKAVPEK